MNRKFLAIVLLFMFFLICSTSCFATDNTSLGNEFQDSLNKSENSMENAGQGILRFPGKDNSFG